jgi:L-alanine-DL-glutamate epimerase-like enolase superfamily enzyme
MKIERVEVFGVAVPLIGEYKNAYRSKSIQKSAIVRITASGGAVGLGNIDPSPGYSKESIEDNLRVLETKLAPLVVGMDPTNIHRVLQEIERAVAGYLDAKAAIEMACVDLTARACGVPVYAYLGGAVKDTLLFNAWIGILPPDEAAAETVAWQKRGFRSAKIKVGGKIEADCDRVKAVREAVGPDFKLRIDANAGYDADTSIKLARMVAPCGMQLFEQPVPADDIAGMARVRREANAIGVPIMADESVLDHASLIRIIQANAADIVKVKVMKQGGFVNTRRMIATAEAAGIRCVVGHGFGLGINTMAEIMLAATSNNVIDGLECVGPLKTADDIVTHKLDLGTGGIALPGGPGLGVTLDEAKLARYRFEAKDIHD